ncbi:MAG: ribonuclease E/G [Magnetospirillum sp.]|nr:ribonuclease E/G [Magnetospirillum sp.]
MAEAEEILFAWGPGESRLALVAGGRVVEFAVDRPELLAGAVMLGRVVEVNPVLDAAFVDIGADRPGFLPGAAALGLSQGKAVTVAVRADARGGKGALLSPAEPAQTAAAKPPALLSRPHPLARLLAAHPTVRRVHMDDAAALAEVRPQFPDLVEHHRDGSAFSLYDAEETFEQALAPVVALPSGGRLTIEPTTALTAIDVDSGPGRPDDANREAVEAIARQLRLRGIGGQVTVDFVSTKGRRGSYKLAEALKRAVASDPVPTHVFGVTPLGMVELTRERRGPSLAELMVERSQGASPRAAAMAGLRRLLCEAASRPGLAPVLVVAPEVAAALAACPEAVAETERRLGRALTVRTEAGRLREDVGVDG